VFGLAVLLLPAKFPSGLLFCLVVPSSPALATLSPSRASYAADPNRKTLRMKTRLGFGVELGFLKVSSHPFNSILRFVFVVEAQETKQFNVCSPLT